MVVFSRQVKDPYHCRWNNICRPGLCTVLQLLSYCPYAGAPVHWPQYPGDKNTSGQLAQLHSAPTFGRKGLLLLSIFPCCGIPIVPLEEFWSNLQRFAIRTKDVSILALFASCADPSIEADTLLTLLVRSWLVRAGSKGPCLFPLPSESFEATWA